MTFDVVDIIKYLKNKIGFALAVVIVKRAKRKGVPAVQYVKTFQERYVEENQNKIDQVLLQKYLSYCQEEFLEKLRKCIPIQSVPRDVIEDEEDISDFGGGSMEWFESSPPSCSKVRSKNGCSISQATSNRSEVNSECFAIKHLNFIESLIKLKEESERKSPISTDLLYSLLHDNSGYQINLSNNRQCSDDSGIGTSEEFSEGNCSINYVSCNAVKHAFQSTNTQQILVNSMKLVLDHVKREFLTNKRQVFFNWKGSLVEYTFKILKECSLNNVECKDMLLSLIFNLLEGMWKDRGLSEHFQWEMRIHIVYRLLADYEDCYEVLQYISERVENIIRQICHKGNDVPLALDKICLLLNLYCKVCHQFSKLTFYINKNNVNHKEEDNVTQLWQQRWCQSESDTESATLGSIEDDQIQVFERLVILISNRYPLIACLAKESLKCALELIRKEESLICRHDDVEYIYD